jgi:mRNA-degrading endonuclease RelE of RelBE toxin-antitoxin system
VVDLVPTASSRIAKVIDALSIGPRPSGARPLVGYPELWRIRVGDYRVVYTVKDAELVVLAMRVAIAARFIANFDSGLPVPVADSSIPRDDPQTKIRSTPTDLMILVNTHP